METVTIEQQVQAGMRTSASRNFVVVPPQRTMQPAPINAEVVHTIDATPSATQHIELRTSAVDRALGFVLATLPLCAFFSAVTLGICVAGFSVPVMSVASLIILSTVFAVVWTVAYLYTLSISAEGVSMYEAQSRWDVIKAEQAMRWQAWMMERRP